jgi:hypothetical protein
MLVEKMWEDNMSRIYEMPSDPKATAQMFLEMLVNCRVISYTVGGDLENLLYTAIAKEERMDWMLWFVQRGRAAGGGSQDSAKMCQELW